ncbi:MAG: ribosomal-processing cysteine protease Prp [Oscillospiraceae bacterium]|nr:ribosomal-processing cysteine protease Prp [Oscillospiraceae bacterium]
MIRAAFLLKGGKPYGFSVSGHAGYASEGRDIVCAAVSSAVQLTANGITEILAQKAGVQADGNAVTLTLGACPNSGAEAFIQALKLHLELLREEYPQNIQITCSEV